MTATKMIRRFVQAPVIPLGDDQCDVSLATGGLALDGDVWDMDGADLTHYRAHPIVLFNHDASLPVGRAENISRNSNRIAARVRFAPAGVSAAADMVRGLVKSGILTGVSAGILPVPGESEPLDPKNPRGGRRIKKWRLLDTSFVSIPSDKGAAVIARAAALAAMAPSSGTTLSHAEAELIAVAAEYGEVLQPTRVATIVDEARRLGVTPAFRYRFIAASMARTLSSGNNEYLKRQRDLESLRRAANE